MQRSTDNNGLRAINDNNMIFISAQPDAPYFHWQVEVYMYQFAKHGIIDRCYALFGYIGNGPSNYVQNLAKRYPTVKYYKDERGPSSYSPTIRPHLLKKFFREYPELGRNVFYHDSDILLIKLPRFDLMLGNGSGYLSNTISYVGYNYIKDCGERYKSAHRQLPYDDIFNNMCKIINIDPNIVKNNQNNSGGAQYLLKNIDEQFWEECEIKCNELYSLFSSYEKKYPIIHHIQKWATDMWVVLWNYWKRGGNTLIHNELDFSWATSTIMDYNNKNIFHLAGITNSNSGDKFYKSKYNTINVFLAYHNNPHIFNHISKTNATYGYVNVIKECYKNVYIKEYSSTKSQVANKEEIKEIQLINRQLIGRQLVNRQHTNRQHTNRQHTNRQHTNRQHTNRQSISNNVTKFKVSTSQMWGGIYVRDDDRKCCGKPVWRTEDRKYIIFYTGSSWIVTNSQYESGIGPNCGGYSSSKSNEPYINHWNCVVHINIMEY